MNFLGYIGLGDIWILLTEYPSGTICSLHLLSFLACLVFGTACEVVRLEQGWQLLAHHITQPKPALVSVI